MFRFSRPLTRLVKPNTAQVLSRQCRAIATTSHKTSYAKSLGFVALGLGFTAYQLSNVVYSEATPYVGSVEDPATKLSFPIYLYTDSEWKRLVGLGVRAVSFLKMNVYVVGMYMRSEDIGELRKLKDWKDFDKSKFLEDAALANQFLDQPYDVSIRLVPVRSTNTQHLRDGFLRLLLQRMRDQSLTEEQEKEILGAIAEFKSNFVSMRVPKDTEFIFTKTKEGGLKMSYEDKDFGTVNNRWLAKNFLMSYLEPKAPSSEAALFDIADGFERLMKEEEK